MDLGDEVDITKVIENVDLTGADMVAAPLVPETKPQTLRRKSNPSWLKTPANIEVAARRNSAELLIKAQTEQGWARLRKQEERKKELKEKKERTQQRSKEEKSQRSQGKKRKSIDANLDDSTSSLTKKTRSSPEQAVAELSTSNSGTGSMYTAAETAEMSRIADEYDADQPSFTQPQYSEEEAEDLEQFFLEGQAAEEAAQQATQDKETEVELEPDLDREFDVEEESPERLIEEDMFGDWDFLNAAIPE